MKTLLQTADYEDVRHRIRPCDVVAFSGRGFVSWLIKVWTGSPISHVAIVTRVQPTAGPESIRLMEATSLDGYTGVGETRMSVRVQQYRGEVYWLPLSDEVRRRLDVDALMEAVYDCDGELYDSWGAGRSPGWLDARTRKGRKFCSQLVALGLKAGGIIAKDCNAAGFTPEDIIMLAIYASTCYQLSGEAKEIPNLNTIQPME